MCRDEGNEPAKLEIVRCLGAWCVAADTLPAEAQAHFERGLGEKDTLLQAHLTALVQVSPAGPLHHGVYIPYYSEAKHCATSVDQSGLPVHALQVLLESECARPAASQLLSRLTRIAAEGSSKVAQRAEGVRASLAVALVASTGREAAASVHASFWEALTAGKAPLLSTVNLARLASADAVLQLHLAGSLLLQVGCILCPAAGVMHDSKAMLVNDVCLRAWTLQHTLR